MAELIETPLTVVHVISCAFLILVVLLQPGKSGGLGAFSGAAAQQVFGGRGAGNFLTKTTWIIASVFLMTSLSLAYLSSTSDDSLAALATGLEDAAQANKAPEAKVKLSSQPGEKPKADPEAIKKALESLVLDAGAPLAPSEPSEGGDTAPAAPLPIDDAAGSPDKSSASGPDPKAAVGSTKAGGPAAPATGAKPGAPKPAKPPTAAPEAPKPQTAPAVPASPAPASPAPAAPAPLSQ